MITLNSKCKKVFLIALLDQDVGFFSFILCFFVFPFNFILECDLFTWFHKESQFTFMKMIFAETPTVINGIIKTQNNFNGWRMFSLFIHLNDRPN